MSGEHHRSMEYNSFTFQAVQPQGRKLFGRMLIAKCDTKIYIF